MNDLVLLFGENVILIVVSFICLVAAVLSGLIVHDAMAMRKKHAQLRANDERYRQKVKNIREMDKTQFTHYVRQKQQEMAAVTAIESLKRP